MTLSSRILEEFNIPKDEIYLDSATTGKLPKSSLNKINDFYNLGGGINRGTHKYAINASNSLETARENLADIFRIHSKQLSFLPSRETAVLNSLFSINAKRNNNIITSVLEDHSIIAPALKFCEITGSSLDYLSMKDESTFLDSLQEKISKDNTTLLFSAMTLGLGVKRNWESIAKLCRDNNVKTIMDMSYLVGHDSFDFSQTIPDVVLSSSSSSALGPQGPAFQIVSEAINETMNPLLVGGGSIISLSKDKYKLGSWSSKFETGTINIAAITGLTNSLELLSDIGFELIKNHNTKLRKQLHKGLETIQNVETIDLEGIEYGPILSFRSDAVDAHDIAIILEDLQNIFVRSGALCSHLFVEEINQNSLVQLSTHIYNSEQEIEIFLETMQNIMEEI